MSSKRRRRADASRPASVSSLREEIDRLIARGRFKDAVKQAKIYHRDKPTEESHRLLERAYFERLRQLHQDGMANSAREVAEHLLEFQVTDPALVEPVAAILVAIGMAERGLGLQDRLEAPEARDRLARQAADQAVLEPDRAPEDLREGARKVREALQAVQEGDEARGLDTLKDVPRSSPFSDWKRFARGLALYRRRESAEAREHWGRLDPERAPARIAQALRALDRREGEGGPDEDRALEPLERWALLEPVLRPLKELGSLVAQDRWTDAVRALGSTRASLRRIDPALAGRLTEVLYRPVIRAALQMSYHQGQSLLKSFTRAAEPTPLDPRWNRLWALAWDGPQGGLDEAEVYWKKYLEDLKTLDALKPEERTKAQALVWLHLGQGCRDAADIPAPPGESADAEIRAERRRAVSYLENGLRLDPSSRALHVELMTAYQDWDEPEKAAAEARRRLQVVADDFEPLLWLAEHHVQEDEPAEALPYAIQARKVKPLDESAIQAEWSARVRLARHLALAGRFEEGRAELDAAERLRLETVQRVLEAARRIVFERKAGQTEAAEALQTEAQSALVEPTPLWLALRIESARYELPKADQKQYESLWTGALSQKVRYQTAGNLAEILAAYFGAGIAYPGREEHVRQVVEYLGRTTRIKYGRVELRHACGFLSLVAIQAERATPKRAPRRGGRPSETEKARPLLEKLSKRGTTLFPEAPEFPMLLGSLEMGSSPFQADIRKARKFFEKAQALAQAHEADDPEAARVLPQVRQLLTKLDDLTSGPFGSPFGPMGPMPDELFDMINEMLGGEDDEDDDEWDEEPEPPFRFPFPLPPPAPRPRRPKSGGKTTKKKKRK
jgi:hypothetical protein